MRREGLWENSVLLAMVMAGLFVAGLFIVEDSTRTHGWLSLSGITGIGQLAATFAVGMRAILIGVGTDDEGFVVRNIFRTRHIPFDQVESFRLTRSRRLNNPLVIAELADGSTLRIASLTPGPGGILWQRRRVLAALERLNSHIDARGIAFDTVANRTRPGGPQDSREATS